jgi:hypothetical protein
MARALEDINLNSPNGAANFFKRKESAAENLKTNFDAISALVKSLRFNVEDKVEKHHVESALQVMFWPTNDNVWDKAETICMKRAKEIFSHILNGHKYPQTPPPNLKECLQVLVYLGEMREGVSR